jgi:hypothetical protein
MVVVAGVVGIVSTAAVQSPAAARIGRAATVGLLRPEAPAPLLSEVLLRVTGELRSSGLEPRIIEVGPREAASCDPTDAERARACLARVSAERGVDAILALGSEPVPATVAVWAADRTAGRSVWRRMSVRTGREHVAETLAIRAGELLRSCLVEIDLMTRESIGAVEPPAARPSPQADRDGEPAIEPRSATSAGPRPTPPSPATPVTPASPRTRELEAAPPEVRSVPPSATETRRPAGDAAGAREGAPPRGTPQAAWAAGVGAGVAAVMSLDGVGPALLPEIRMSAALGSGWIVRVTAAGLGTSAPVASGTGDASVTQDQILGGVYYHLRSGRQVRPQLAVRAGALRTSAEGRADAPQEGRRATQWSLLLDGGMGVALSMTARIDVVLAAHVQLAEPYPALRFVDQVVATTAHPGLLITAALDVWP